VIAHHFPLLKSAKQHPCLVNEVQKSIQDFLKIAGDALVTERMDNKKQRAQNTTPAIICSGE
jgi:hypothetical protein